MVMGTADPRESQVRSIRRLAPCSTASGGGRLTAAVRVASRRVDVVSVCVA